MMFKTMAVKSKKALKKQLATRVEKKPLIPAILWNVQNASLASSAIV